jgi:hypothetical protein
MWLTALSCVIWVVNKLCGIGAWLHDRQEQRIGATDQVVKDQAKALRTLSTALQVPRVQSQDELKDDLRGGKL